MATLLTSTPPRLGAAQNEHSPGLTGPRYCRADPFPSSHRQLDTPRDLKLEVQPVRNRAAKSLLCGCRYSPPRPKVIGCQFSKIGRVD